MPNPESRITNPACALTIAGSDSGGGAGIQADLKTFQALGVHGLSVITAVTAQNTQGVRAVHAVPTTQIAAQLDAVFEDFPIGAVKTGMLGTAAATRRVARELARRAPRWLVVDPVMVATSGARLLDEDAVHALREQLIPLAQLITPNLPEAEILLGRKLRTARACERAGADLLALGARAVLLKGGHGGGVSVVDRLFDTNGMVEFTHPRLDREGHGTGCTLAAAITAGLAGERALRESVRRAVDYVQRALAAGYRPGKGRVWALRHGSIAPP